MDRPVRPEHFRRIEKREESAGEAPPAAKKESSDAERISERRKKTPESRGKKWIRRKKQAPEPGRKWKRRKPAAGAPEEDYDPFEDGEFAECRKIMPEDLCCLHPADRSLKGNRSPPVRLSGFRAPASGKNRVGQVLPGSAGSIRPAGKIHGGDVRFSLFQIQPPYSSGEGERRLLVPPNQCPGSPQDRWFLSGCSGRRRSSSAEKLLNPGCRTSSESPVRLEVVSRGAFKPLADLDEILFCVQFFYRCCAELIVQGTVQEIIHGFHHRGQIRPGQPAERAVIFRTGLDVHSGLLDQSFFPQEK